MDSGIAGIADRRRRKSFVHASVVRVASILKLLVCQLAACGVEPVGNGAVHAQRHVLVDSVQDDPRHLTVIVRIACLGFGDGRDVHDTFAFASIWHAQCVQFVDACRDHFLEDVLGGLVLDAVGSGLKPSFEFATRFIWQNARAATVDDRLEFGHVLA